MSAITAIIEFTREDFLNTAKPYEFVSENAEDQLHEEQLRQLVCENAKRVGIRNFRRLYVDYCESASHKMRREKGK